MYYFIEQEITITSHKHYILYKDSSDNLDMNSA